MKDRITSIRDFKILYQKFLNGKTTEKETAKVRKMLIEGEYDKYAEEVVSNHEYKYIPKNDELRDEEVEKLKKKVLERVDAMEKGFKDPLKKKPKRGR